MLIFSEIILQSLNLFGSIGLLFRNSPHVYIKATDQHFRLQEGVFNQAQPNQ